MQLIKFQKERPTSGQWVAVWQHEGKSWSIVLSFTDEGVKRYCNEDDEWCCMDDLELGRLDEVNAVYLQVVGR